MNEEPNEFSLCFFPEQNSYVRYKTKFDIYDVIRAVTYRCGMCGNHFADVDLSEHFHEEKSRWMAKKTG